jgi:large subunit ribosomal protein L10
MVLKRADKEQLVENLADRLREARAVVVTSFRVLTMSESMGLRRALRADGGSLRVVPKRLLRRTAERLGWPASFTDTPQSVLVAWSAERRAPARALHGFVQRHPEALLLGGTLEASVLDVAAVERLALLPPAETLRAQLVSVLAGPLRGLLGVWSGVLRGLPAVLQAKSAQ